MTGEERQRQAAFNSGATGYIAIPIDSKEMMVRVRAEIERKRLQELATFGRKQMDPSLKMMVHDLKNVLTVIETNLELMETKNPGLRTICADVPPRLPRVILSDTGSVGFSKTSTRRDEPCFL